MNISYIRLTLNQTIMYYIKSEYKNLNDTKIWEIIVDYIQNKKIFHSVTGVSYEAVIINNSIYYKGGTGLRGENGEYLTKDEILKNFNLIKNESFNTSSPKKTALPIYRQRTPFAGLLILTGIATSI